MLRVRFKNHDYVFVGASLTDGGALADEAAFRAGRASYAHLYLDGTVSRYGERIGGRDDVTVLGEFTSNMTVDDVAGAVGEMLFGDTWERPLRAGEKERG